MKADLVYKIHYEGELSILDLELQTDADPDMPLRMLKYHVGLYDKHRLPVISVVLYPFKTSIPDSLFEEKSGKEILLTFRHRVVALWEHNARDYLQKGIIPMYTFLPAMQGTSASLLLQAIDGMKQHYTKWRLGDQLAQFRTILGRSTMLSERDKQLVKSQLQTYNSLMDQSDFAQEKKAEGEIQGAQKIVVTLVEARFPALTELAQERVALVRSTEALRLLVRQFATVSDEDAARWLLGTLAA